MIVLLFAVTDRVRIEARESTQEHVADRQLAIKIFNKNNRFDRASSS